MKQASLSSSIVHGGGKRRGEEGMSTSGEMLLPKKTSHASLVAEAVRLAQKRFLRTRTHINLMRRVENNNHMR